MDKHYLADLDATGVNVVPSRFIERGRQVNLLEMLTDTGWHDAIVKPCISGAARHTYRVNPATAAAVEPILNQLLTTESMILQPFQHDVIETGEDTLMVFGGCYTHAVRKTAKPGDFRVQDDHGGTVQEYTPTLDQVELAERAMAACRPVPAYGRVDMIRDNSERLAIMELELIEPELWLRLHPPAAIRLADSIAKMVANEQTRR
jgi:glutathione synthase/RimK-type ligase-like ATP-grasp enzyme